MKEETVGYGPAWVVLTVFVAIIIMAIWRLVRDLSAERKHDGPNLSEEFRLQVMRQAREILEARVPYYVRLHQRGRDKFVARLSHLLASKRFITVEPLELKAEQLVLTASAFVMAGFGLEDFTFKRFHTIVLYPDVFGGHRQNRAFRGSTSTRGVIRLSWKHIEQGFQVEDDGMNVALHEIAHALMIMVEEERMIDAKVFRNLQYFQLHAEALKRQVGEGPIPLLRRYAGTNRHEFFACSTEEFFEQPEAFKQQLPDLYFTLCELLHQDPTRPEAGYAFELSEGERSRRMRKFLNVVLPNQDRFYNYVHWYLIAGMLGVLPINLVFWKMQNPMLLGAMILATAVVGMFIYFRRLYRSGFMSGAMFVLFLFGGFTSTVINGMLLLNASAWAEETIYVEPVAFHIDGDQFVLESQKLEARRLKYVPVEQVGVISTAGKMTFNIVTYDDVGLLGLAFRGRESLEVEVDGQSREVYRLRQ